MNPQIVIEIVEGLMSGMRAATPTGKFILFIPNSIDLKVEIGDGETLEQRLLKTKGVDKIERSNKRGITAVSI